MTRWSVWWRRPTYRTDQLVTASCHMDQRIVASCQMDQWIVASCQMDQCVATSCQMDLWVLASCQMSQWTHATCRVISRKRRTMRHARTSMYETLLHQRPHTMIALYIISYILRLPWYFLFKCFLQLRRSPTGVRLNSIQSWLHYVYSHPRPHMMTGTRLRMRIHSHYTPLTRKNLIDSNMMRITHCARDTKFYVFLGNLV
jgi:hypothetical protein